MRSPKGHAGAKYSKMVFEMHFLTMGTFIKCCACAIDIIVNIISGTLPRDRLSENIPSGLISGLISHSDSPFNSAVNLLRKQLLVIPWTFCQS